MKKLMRLNSNYETFLKNQDTDGLSGDFIANRALFILLTWATGALSANDVLSGSVGWPQVESHWWNHQWACVFPANQSVSLLIRRYFLYPNSFGAELCTIIWIIPSYKIL